jgi:Protein of unknown function (DUF551)
MKCNLCDRAISEEEEFFKVYMCPPLILNKFSCIPYLYYCNECCEYLPSITKFYRFKNKWISVKDQMPPKDKKFIFSYHYGEGLGQWGQCYTTINGNSERTHESYILVLHPSEISDGNDPFKWDEEYMIYMEVKWMQLPKPPE